MIFMIASISLSADLKMMGISSIEEFQDSSKHNGFVDKTTYHKRWNHYLPFSDKSSKKAIIEELFDEKWPASWNDSHGFMIDIQATRWNETNSGLKMAWQIHCKGSKASIVNNFFEVTQRGCCRCN